VPRVITLLAIFQGIAGKSNPEGDIIVVYGGCVIVRVGDEEAGLSARRIGIRIGIRGAGSDIEGVIAYGCASIADIMRPFLIMDDIPLISIRKEIETAPRYSQIT